MVWLINACFLNELKTNHSLKLQGVRDKGLDHTFFSFSNVREKSPLQHSGICVYCRVREVASSRRPWPGHTSGCPLRPLAPTHLTHWM